MPRSVCLRLREFSEADQRFGSVAELESFLVDRFRTRFDVAASIWSHAERPANEADLVVDIALDVLEPRSGDIDIERAALDFLVWSAIPFVPWWIRDVSIDPGVRLHIEASYAGEGSLDRQQQFDVALAPVPTCLRDRYPVWSWATLGAAVVPPFVFREYDAAHLHAAIADEVEFRVALELARWLKGANLGENEILRAPAVEKTELVYDAHPELWRVRVWSDTKGPDFEVSSIMPLGSRELRRRRVSLEALGANLDGTLLRLEATRRDGETLQYSLRVPDRLTVTEGR
ncbi:MAG: hypothetical protein AAF517_19250 [Planctomycetota bacterium]